VNRVATDEVVITNRVATDEIAATDEVATDRVTTDEVAIDRVVATDGVVTDGVVIDIDREMDFNVVEKNVLVAYSRFRLIPKVVEYFLLDVTTLHNSKLKKMEFFDPTLSILLFAHSIDKMIEKHA
jgi:hypothetical protein